MPFTKTEKIVTTTIEETHATFDRVEGYKKGPKEEPIPDVTDDLDIYGVMLWRLGEPTSVHLRRILEHLFTPLEMVTCPQRLVHLLS